MAIDKRKKSPRNKKPDEWLAQRELEGAVLARAAKNWGLENILNELGIGLALGNERLLGFLDLVKGRFNALDQLREAIVAAERLEEWKSGDFLAARTEDRAPTLDEIIEWKVISKIEVAGGLAAAAWTCGVDEGRAILAAAMPEVIKSAVELAKNGESMVNHLSQKLLFEASGMLPKGAGTIVNVNQQNNTLVQGLPQWDEVDKVVSRAYFGKTGEQRKALPPASVENVIDIVPESAAEPVESYGAAGEMV